MEKNALPTEQRNQDTIHIDEASTIEMLRMINHEDKKVATCVERHLDEIAAAIDAASEKFAAAPVLPAAWALWIPPSARPPMACPKSGWSP